MPQSALIRAFRIPEQLLNSLFRLNSTREADIKSLHIYMPGSTGFSFRYSHIKPQPQNSQADFLSSMQEKWDWDCVRWEWVREIAPKKHTTKLGQKLICYTFFNVSGLDPNSVNQISCVKLPTSTCWMSMFSGHSSPSFCFWLDSPEVPCNSSWRASHSQNQP